MVYWMHVRSQLLTLIEGGGATQGKRRKTKKKRERLHVHAMATWEAVMLPLHHEDKVV